MAHYFVSAPFHQHHLLNILAVFENHSLANEMFIQLPSWRPGRYELGNFAKNIQKFSVSDENGNSLPFEKTSKDQWKIFTNGNKIIKLKYTYFAADLNAGSTYVDSDQVYINPVNCFMYNVKGTNEECLLNFDLPSEYTIATSMEMVKKNQYKATSFDELADSPLIASSSLQHFTFTKGNLPVHLWFQGECKPDIKRITDHFEKFTQWQLNLFPSCPTKEFHYLIQILPTPFYHGVEHKNSTVLALGPGYALNDVRYNDLLGVACHEFYHVWNIKTIRPAEMWPYDFTRENYFTTGFVAEGVTTYMGDYILWQSGVFSNNEFFHELSNQVQKHLDNFGRYNHSVTQSGWDTWLDGYVPGVPDRKVSIYVEGCLLALMTDIIIMKNTGCSKSLHDVMRILYTDFYLQNKGYTYTDYVKTVSTVAGKDMTAFFAEYALQTKDYRSMLDECLSWIGLEIQETPSVNYCETHLGFKLNDAADKSIITAIHPESPSYNSLAINDQIIAVNGFAVKGDAHKWINYFSNLELPLTVMRNGKLNEICLKSDGKNYYKTYSINKMENSSKEAEKLFDFWKIKN